MRIASRAGIAWSWVALFIAAQVADAITTVASLSHGGAESNPLVEGLISGAGIAGYVLVKFSALAIALGLIVLANWLRARLPAAVGHRVAQALFVGVQAAVAIQLLAVMANLITLGREIRA
jgi:hypothetical protein